MDTQAWMEAAGSGNTATVEILLAQGADVDAHTASRETALMRAASKGHMDTVQSLLEKGANANANRQDGMTALTLAVFFGHVDVVNVLLNNGADPRTRDCHGASAMDWASSRGYPNIARLLKDAEFFKATAPEITGHIAPHIITSNEAPPALNPNERLPDDLQREWESTLATTATTALAATAITGTDEFITIPDSVVESDDNPAIEEIGAIGNEQPSVQEHGFFNYKRYRERSPGKKLLRLALIAPAVLFVSGLSIYSVRQEMRQDAVQFRPPATDYYNLPNTLTLQYPQQGNSNTKPQTQIVPNPPPPVAVLNPNALSATGLVIPVNKKRRAPDGASESVSMQPGSEPVIISLAQPDSVKTEPREEPVKNPLPSNRSITAQQSPKALPVTASRETAVDHQTSPPPVMLSTTSPKKKVIQWP
ncbi:MAG: ankyrin repeat domain-containing protein [Pyrinomonadaceae bacterium]